MDSLKTMRTIESKSKAYSEEAALPGTACCTGKAHLINLHTKYDVVLHVPSSKAAHPSLRFLSTYLSPSRVFPTTKEPSLTLVGIQIHVLSPAIPHPRNQGPKPYRKCCSARCSLGVEPFKQSRRVVLGDTCRASVLPKKVVPQMGPVHRPWRRGQTCSG